MIHNHELQPFFDMDIREALPDAVVSSVITAPPFVHPMLNGRDLGLVPGSAVRPGFVYRCGLLTESEDGWEDWLATNVKTVVDFRHSSERDKMPEPALPGIRHVWFPPTADYRPDMDDFAAGDGSEGWKIMYLKYLRIYRETIVAVLEHIRDRPEDPILYHCSAGRDRTGVMSGILHALSGTPEHAVVHDFMLTRIGLEPRRSFLEAHARSLADAAGVGHAELSPAIVNCISLRPTSWTAFSQGVRDEFGGWDEYVVGFLGFSPGELEVIKQNLRRQD